MFGADMIYIDGGYLAYQVIGNPEHLYDPWGVTDKLVDEGAIICIDSSTSLRRETYSWYKANRENVNPSFDYMRAQAHQWREDVIKRHPDSCRAYQGLEADDLVALYASRDDTILGEDKDFLQLEGVKLVDINGEEWADRRLKKFSALPITQGEKFIAWQLATGDVTDSIPRLLYTKDRTTLKTIMKHPHPLWLLLQMVNTKQAIELLDCLIIPTPLAQPYKDTLRFVAERYGFDY